MTSNHMGQGADNWGDPMNIVQGASADELIQAGYGRAAAPAPAPAAAPPKCDGNHGGPPCADPECWAKPDELEQIIDGYLEDYELIGEDEAGRDGCYRPTETERGLIKDAFMGLLAHDEWDAAWGRLINQRAAERAALAAQRPSQSAGVVLQGDRDDPPDVSLIADPVLREVVTAYGNGPHYEGLQRVAALLRQSQSAGEPAGWVSVPLEFMKGFHTLAHNYSLRAEPPDYYDGRAGDAFSNAYRRCGEDLARLRAMLASPPPTDAARASGEAPIDMVLHCPACGMQHIDAPEKVSEARPVLYGDAWLNPPHRSHLCHGCGHIWRPADVPTNGVAAVKTKGKADSPIVTPAEPDAARVEAEARYRLLAAGEPIRADDEFIADDGVTWQRPVGWEIGMKYTHFFKTARRRVDVDLAAGKGGA